MSSDVSNIIDTHLVPKRTADLTTAGAAAAAQGQFQAIDAATAIVIDTAAHALRVRCKPVNIFGALDVNSPVTIRVRTTNQNVVKATSAAVGTLISAMVNTIDGVFVVLPNASGQVDLTVDTTAANGCVVTLQHRHYVATASISTT